MKINLMLSYCTKILLISIIPISIFSQENNISNDTLYFKQKYGLRIGLDLYKPLVDGIEVNLDYRLTDKLYVASEIGLIKKTTQEDYLNFTSKGNYIKSGVDYNLYTNWLDMQNMIYSGLRIGYSSFSQEINNYTVYDTSSNIWGLSTIDSSILNNNLSSLWIELIIGVKAELINNLFLGFNFQIKNMLNNKTKNLIENLYVPGFNRTYQDSSYGVGFGYSISYLIPIIKK